MNKLVHACMLVAFAGIITHTANAKIWRVNNQSNYNFSANRWGSNYGGSEAYPVFDSFQNALTWPGAGAGNIANNDTIYVEASGTAYAYDARNVPALRKPLTIIGTGYMPGNALSLIAGETEFNNIQLNPGCEGMRLIGITYNSSAGLNILCSDVSIERSWIKFSGLYLDSGIDNIKILGCFFGSRPDADPYPGDYISESSSNDPATNVTISNCIFRCAVNITKAMINKFNNNTLELNTTATTYALELTNVGQFHNNILKKTQGVATNARVRINNQTNFTSLPNVQNCISYSATDQFGSGNNCIVLATASQQASLFRDPGTVQLTDEALTLKPAFVSGNLGTDGTQRGAFGGEFPYALSGLGPIPVVRNIVTNGANTPGRGINVKVTANTVR